MKPLLLDNALGSIINVYVSHIIDRGITRINRSRLCEELLNSIFNIVRTTEYKSNQQAVAVDTVACRFNIETVDKSKVEITISGDETKVEDINIVIDDTNVFLNGSPIATSTLVVLVTSMLLRSTNEEVTVTVA